MAVNKPPWTGSALGGPGAMHSPFLPIADLAFLADGEVNALVAPSGSVEWFCAPRPDSPSVFGALLDRAAGRFRVGLADATAPVARRYLPGTMVLETTWQTRAGWLTVLDALVIAPWREEAPGGQWERTPADHRAAHVLVRIACCTNGAVELEAVCEPVFDYGLADAAWSYLGSTYHVAITRGGGASVELGLVGDLRLGIEGRRVAARHTLRDGESAYLALTWAGGHAPGTAAEARALLDATSRYWRDWLDAGEFPDHRWRAHLQRSALTLKGLCYAPTGAMLAAATTSLAEMPRGVRNWDYRYSWIRDSTFMLWGLYTLGFVREADDFFAFVADRADRAELQVLYGVCGETQLDEQVLGHLSGYERARPVRIGNGAFTQRQHDVWGAVTDSVGLHRKRNDHLSERVWHMVVPQVEAALAHWREPDRGIWEVRGEPRHFTSSKVMCWVAAERGARLATLQEEDELARAWAVAATEIHADVCANGLDARGVFTQSYGSRALDASLLLLPLVRFLPSDDERVRATVLAIAEELTVDGLVLRYRPQETNDGLSGEEATFTICSFWLVSALAEIGEGERARALCEKLLSLAGPLGLYAEEIDPRTTRQYGNFPQAFTHLALINAVTHVARHEQGEAQGFLPARG